jgi:hypothetical protein
MFKRFAKNKNCPLVEKVKSFMMATDIVDYQGQKRIQVELIDGEFHAVFYLKKGEAEIAIDLLREHCDKI